MTNKIIIFLVLLINTIYLIASEKEDITLGLQQEEEKMVERITAENTKRVILEKFNEVLKSAITAHVVSQLIEDALIAVNYNSEEYKMLLLNSILKDDVKQYQEIAILKLMLEAYIGKNKVALADQLNFVQEVIKQVLWSNKETGPQLSYLKPVEKVAEKEVQPQPRYRRPFFSLTFFKDSAASMLARMKSSWQWSKNKMFGFTNYFKNRWDSLRNYLFRSQ